MTARRDPPLRRDRGAAGKAEGAQCARCGDWILFETDGNGVVVEHCPTCSRLRGLGLRVAPRSPESAKGAPYIYKPKRCACGRLFTPTGPRAIRCGTCLLALLNSSK